jgi:N6-L-threonylcarbamoyladenine synthase
MKVLGLETSCDETGVAVFDAERGLLAQALHSQPEIASRDHIRRLLPLIKKVLRDAGIERPDAVAYTAGPGLVGALMVGSGLANGLGLAWSCPVIRIHHMEGHLLAPMLEEDAPAYPFLALLVSGGHTMLVAVKGLGLYDVLGSTLDDAVGEAFDKTAKLLGLDYPGGPALAALAENGDPQAYAFPRPMLKSPGLDFSFSGLKTAVIAASFQCAAIDTLVTRSIQAAKQTNLDRIVVAGGVGANLHLREELAERFGGRVYYPRPEFCTDNGAMIAIAGALRLADGSEPATIHATARWSLETLTPPGSANPA